MLRVLNAVLHALGWAFLAAVLLAAGLGAYVYRRFSPEDARRLAASQLSALLHREVVIDRLVVSPRGLKVVGLRVRQARPGAGGDLLACDSALVTIKLRSLLDRRLEFDTVLLQSPQISLTRDAGGNWDSADVFGSTRPSAGRAPLPVAMAAAETVVRDGTLRVDDQMRGRRLSLRGLSLRVDSFDPDRSFPVEASFTVSDVVGGRSVAATVSAAGRVDLAGLRWSSATASAESLRVGVAGVELDGRASVDGFTTPRLRIEVSAPPLGPAQWRALLGRGLDLSLPATRWTLAADVPARGMLEIERLSVAASAGAATAAGLFDFAADPPAFSIEASASNVDLARLSAWSPALAARALSGAATLRASVTGGAGERLRVREADVSVRGFGGRWGTHRVEGVDADASWSGDRSRLAAKVSKGRLMAAGNVFDDVALDLDADPRAVALRGLSLRWGGARVRLRGRAEGLPSPRRVELSGSADRVDWDSAAKLVADVRAAISTRTASGGESAAPRPWLRAFKYEIPRGFPDTVGHVRVGEVMHPNFHCKNVELLWSLRGVTPALNRINGEARLSLGPGRVADIPAVQNANRFLRVVFLPFIFMHKMNRLSVFSAATAYPKTLDFTRIDGEYGASRGVATTRYFHVDSPQLVAYAEGAADFGRERVDMNILTRLTDYQGTLPEWWVDEKGRPAIGFRVKGDINQPELEPRFNKIGEGEIERKVDEGRRGAHQRFLALEKLQTW